MLMQMRGNKADAAKEQLHPFPSPRFVFWGRTMDLRRLADVRHARSKKYIPQDSNLRPRMDRSLNPAP